jgi:phage protein D
VSGPAFAVEAEGVPLPVDLSAAIASVSVTLNANQPSAVSLEVHDPRLHWIDAVSGLLQEGRRINVSMGYGRALRPMIAADIVALDADLDDSGGLLIHVHGFDALHRASRGSEYEQSLDGESDSIIVQKIARNVLGLNAAVSLQGGRSRRRLKSNVTTLQYLEQLASEYGCVFWVDDGLLHFQRDPLGVRIPLRRRVNLAALSVRLSTAGQVGEVEARAWDTTQKQEIVAVARAAGSPAYAATLSIAGLEQTLQAGASSKRVLFAGIDATTQEEAQRFADNELQRLRRNLVTAEGSTIGNPEIRVGTSLVIVEFGRFSGEYVVESARHVLDQGGYKTSFQARQYL